MRPNTLALALALAFCSLPMAALAQDSGDAAANAQDAPAASTDQAPAAEEEGGPVTWSLAVTSDYVFRGITQTDYDPALQAGLTYTWDSSIYVGAWTSNVDFGDGGPHIEFDTYIGWGHDFDDDWNLDVSLVHYAYFGEDEDYGNIDYIEGIGKISWKEMLTLTLAYAPDYSNADISSFYANLGGSWELGDSGFSVNAGVGYTDFSDDVPGYTDWNLGVSKSWGPATFALNYYDTDIDFPSFLDHNHASDQLVLTVSFGN